MNGGADRQVSPSHAMNLARLLEGLHKPYHVHVFGGDGHVISDHRVERDRMAAEWFRKHVK
jgi:dipeptidyl aminopeptidase/acylaminoacyl peptidase